MRRLAVAFLILLALGATAEAHKLKVFATVEGQSVHGYAFFIGGGRPEGSSWVAKDAAGGRIAEGTTDAEGGFAFALPGGPSGDVTITVDTHEAHIASVTLTADRFSGAEVPAGPAASPAATAPSTPNGDARLAALVSASVQKQVEPLLERIEVMDSRLRYADILSGVFLIIGLVGIGLWARGRRP